MSERHPTERFRNLVHRYVNCQLDSILLLDYWTVASLTGLPVPVCSKIPTQEIFIEDIAMLLSLLDNTEQNSPPVTVEFSYCRLISHHISDCPSTQSVEAGRSKWSTDICLHPLESFRFRLHWIQLSTSLPLLSRRSFHPVQGRQDIDGVASRCFSW